MTFTSNAGISEEAVKAEAEARVQENLVFREAFRPLDATGINSSVMKVPVPKGTMGEVKAIGEGASYPTDHEDFEKVTIDHEKFGKGVVITDEAIADSRLDAVREQANQQLRKLAEGMDRQAYQVLNTENNDGSFGSESFRAATGTLSYDAIVDAMTTLEDAPYNYMPQVLFVGPKGKGDLLKSSEFQASENLANNAITRGEIGTVAGLRVFVSNAGDLGAGEAIMVDPDFYGYESTRQNVESETVEQRLEDKRVIKVNTRKGWKSMKQDAALTISA